MGRVFIYWDNSSIFHEAQRLAEERSEGPNARYRIRVHFDNMLRLAHADRPIERALAVGSVPPEMRQLWNRMESNGTEVRLFDRGSRERGEQEMPDRLLQLRMLERRLGLQRRPRHCGPAYRRRRRWAENNGVFVPLDDFYDAITFMEPSRPGFELAQARDAAPLDLSRRSMTS